MTYRRPEDPPPFRSQRVDCARCGSEILADICTVTLAGAEMPACYLCWRDQRNASGPVDPPRASEVAG